MQTNSSTYVPLVLDIPVCTGTGTCTGTCAVLTGMDETKAIGAATTGATTK